MIFHEVRLVGGLFEKKYIDQRACYKKTHSLGRKQHQITTLCFLWKASSDIISFKTYASFILATQLENLGLRRHTLQKVQTSHHPIHQKRTCTGRNHLAMKVVNNVNVVKPRINNPFFFNNLTISMDIFINHTPKRGFEYLMVNFWSVIYIILYYIAIL